MVLSFQSIQRRLEEIEVDFKDLEEKGVVLEQTLRGEDGETPQCCLEMFSRLKSNQIHFFPL